MRSRVPFALVIFLVACGGGSDMPDASFDAFDAGTATSFVWNPWPEGPVPYRIELHSCNDDAARPGRCNTGFSCTGSVDIERVALTRAERVCVAEDAITSIVVERFEPYAPVDAIDVPVRVTLNGAPFDGAGTLRLIDARGAEAYSGDLVDGATLRLERGEMRAFVGVRGDARNPEWTRGAQVFVGDGVDSRRSAIEIPLEAGFVTLNGEGRARLLNRDTGVDLEVALPTTIALVPGPYDVTLVRDAGSAPQPELGVDVDETVDVTLSADVVRAEGEVRVDGVPVVLGRVVFHDPETGHEVRAEIADGRYGVELLDRTWAVYLDTRDVAGPLPQMRALTHEAVRPHDALDLEVSTVSLRGSYTVDGVAAPVLGERFGFLQVVDALGIAGAGVSIEDGAFEGRVYATRASLTFVGTHGTAPRLAQTVAESVLLDDVPIALDIRTAQVEVLLRIEGGPFPVAPDIVARGRGVITIGDATRNIDALLPPRGEAIASLVVPPGRWGLRYVNERFDEVPIGQLELGEIEVEVDGETRAEFDLTLHELFLSIPPTSGRARFSAPDGSWAETNVSGSAPGMVKLFGGTWQAHELCTAGCGRLVLGWLSLEPG